jgi:hypothetical protein
MIILNETCGACPEQYDAYHVPGGEPGEYAISPIEIDFLNKAKVAYLRLRHGYFTVTCGLRSELVYHAHPNGDGLFDNDEREKYLREACKAIEKWVERQKEDSATIEPGATVTVNDQDCFEYGRKVVVKEIKSITGHVAVLFVDDNGVEFLVRHKLKGNQNETV